VAPQSDPSDGLRVLKMTQSRRGQAGGTGCTLLALALVLGHSSAAALLAPPRTVRSSGGVLDITLEVVVARRQVAKGVSFMTRTYNGSVPGPTMIVRPGDNVSITLVNRLGSNRPMPGSDAPLNMERAANSTNLHIHGIFDSPIHDNTFVTVDPGDLHTWHYEVDSRTTSSLLWYHPHFGGSSALQLAGGMFGAFVVEHPAHEALFSAWDTHLLVLQKIDMNRSSKDSLFRAMECKDGAGVSAPPGCGTNMSDLPLLLDNPEGFDGVMLLVNEDLAPRVPLQMGARARLRLLNACEDMMRLGLQAGNLPPHPKSQQGRWKGRRQAAGCALEVVAFDGVFLDAPRRQDYVLLPPGGRVELSVSCFNVAAPLPVQLVTTGAEDLALGGLFPPNHIVLGLDLHGHVAAKAGPSVVLPGPPLYLPDLRSAAASAQYRVVFGDAKGSHSVNGRAYSGNVSYSMAVGSVQEWQLRGGEPPALLKLHPYHQHSTHFQIVAVDADWTLELSADDLASFAAVGDYRDTVALYHGLRYTVRFQPPFPGKMMVHCHILKHEDEGMMLLADMVPPDAGSDAAARLPAADVPWLVVAAAGSVLLWSLLMMKECLRAHELMLLRARASRHSGREESEEVAIEAGLVASRRIRDAADAPLLDGGGVQEEAGHDDSDLAADARSL